MPEIRSCAESYGTITAAGSKTLAGVEITACIGDQQSAMAGQRCFREGILGFDPPPSHTHTRARARFSPARFRWFDPLMPLGVCCCYADQCASFGAVAKTGASGMAKTTYGTGAFTLINTGTTPSPSKNGLLTTALFQLGPNEAPVYALEGAVAACAIGQDWFCDKLGMFPDAGEIHRLAGEVPAGAEGVYFVSAFGGLLAPRWRDDARGALVGLTLAHDKSHVARAVVEGIAHQVREVTTSMVQDSGVPLAAMRVDGGVARSAPLLQFQADLLNTKVERPHNIETTALGAACVGHELDHFPARARALLFPVPRRACACPARRKVSPSPLMLILSLVVVFARSFADLPWHTDGNGTNNTVMPVPSPSCL